MDEGFPDGRSPSEAQRDARICLRDRLAHAKNPRTSLGAQSPVSRLSSCQSLSAPCSESQRTRRLSPTRVVLSEPVRKADGATSPLATARLASSPLASARLGSNGTNPLGGSLSVGLAVGNYRQSDGAASPLSGARPGSSGTTSIGGSLRLGLAPGNSRRVPPASSAAKKFHVPTQPNSEDPGLNEKKKGEMEFVPEIESMLASARKDLLLAEAGDGSDLATKQQKPLNVDEAIHVALEVVGQERIARAREISDLQTKITSQQEWFAKELLRHSMKSAEAQASTENPRLSKIEKQVEAMRNQIVQQGEATSRERAQREAHDISEPTFASLQKALLSGPDLSQYVQTLVDDRVQQAHAHSPSRSSPVHEAILSSPESAQYVQKLVDDRVQQLFDTQLNAEVLQSLLNAPSTSASMHKAILSCPGLSQYIETVVDDRVQQVADAQFGAESLQERFNAPFTLAFVQKAIFSSSCLSQHVKTLVDVRVQQVADATHELNKELHAFAVRLQEEREERAKSVHDLHSRLAFETANIRAHVEKTNLCLQEASAKERRSQAEEFTEVRAILDAVWARASRLKDSNSQGNFFKYVDSSAGGENEEDGYRYKECVGDAEDINTLYEMVREAVGNSEMIKRDIEVGKDRQDRDQATLQRQLQQMEVRLQLLQNKVIILAEGSPSSD